MKKYFLSLAVLLFVGITAANAQRIAVVDISKVMESLPEYQQAQKELDRVAATWRQEVAKEYDVIKSMYNKYQAEEVLLSDEVRKQRQEEIVNKETSVREMQKQRFGPEGALFKRRKALVQPIQDKVYSVIEDYANSKDYDFILDKGSATGLLFVNGQFDKTEDIIDRVN
ncbi:MAG: OmpH family outer membrane protein [Bacteroidota bacterium]